MTPRNVVFAALAITVALPLPALAQDYRPAARNPGVILSERERRAAYPVRLPGGRVAERAGSGGIPWLYGIGDVYGKASGLPVVKGATPSVLKSTASGGLVPGQEQR
ncbi:hypothetical protein E3C22_11200 [Jiella endophytica]|uniref:Uncharacterized protein n=1 Tax=Jiella endophytica TaxID=2558362 RepID=A0A4Y8RKN5_9HYPH|nr:hypothetical protein [Jiella endophytica]TFF23006.1 hypothetical protein E3C22_11200 [Jiella endophytica]